MTSKRVFQRTDPGAGGHRRSLLVCLLAALGLLAFAPSALASGLYWGNVPGSPAPLTGGSLPIHLSIDPSGTHFATANENGTVSVYTIGAGGTPSLLGMVTEGGKVRDVAYNPAGNLLAVANQDNNALYVYRVDGSGYLTLGSTTPIGGGLLRVKWSPDGHLFATAANQIHVFSAAADGTLTPASGSPITVSFMGFINALAIDAAGDQLAIGGTDHNGNPATDTFPLAGATPGTARPVSWGGGGNVDDLQFSPDGSKLAVVALGNPNALWTLVGPSFYGGSVGNPPGTPRAVGWSHDGSEEMVATQTDGVQVYGGSVGAGPFDVDHNAFDAQFTPNDQYIVTANPDNTVSVLSLQQDNNLPNCTIQSINESGTPTEVVSVLDNPGPGLASIVPTVLSKLTNGNANGTVSVQAFTAGTVGPVLMTATKTPDPGLGGAFDRSTVWLATVTDTLSNSKVCQ